LEIIEFEIGILCEDFIGFPAREEVLVCDDERHIEDVSEFL
jgi:hypothetical protein